MGNGMRKIVVPGGSGFLGQVLARWFDQHGWQVVVLTRGESRDVGAVRTVNWDGRTLGPWQAELEGAAAVVNLAGRSVNCRYTRRNRRTMMNSRVESTRVLGEAIARCERPPSVWLNSSTATIYKHSLDRPMDEVSGTIGATPEAKDAFSIEVATAWEAAFAHAVVPGTRKVTLRSAMVLGPEPGSVLPVLQRLARFGLGGSMGSGQQYVSWIHKEDFCRAIEFLIEHPEITGPVNLSAPQPVTNRELMQIMRAATGRSFGLPATAWMLEVGAFLLRTETELVIKSRRVVPGRLLAAGFEFHYPELKGAVEKIVCRGLL